MKGRAFPLALILGSVLIAVSLAAALLLHLDLKESRGQMQHTVTRLIESIGDGEGGIPDADPRDAAMPVLALADGDYVALLEIPSAGLTLPVRDLWDKNALTDGPARFYGSAYDGSLVIGGFDHPDHFGFCRKIGQEALLTLTDLTGNEFTYTVSRVDRADRADAAWLTEGEYDLTLFCRGLLSPEYVAVRCTRVPA